MSGQYMFMHLKQKNKIINCDKEEIINVSRRICVFLRRTTHNISFYIFYFKSVLFAVGDVINLSINLKDILHHSDVINQAFSYIFNYS